MKNGYGKVILVHRIKEPKDIIVGIISLLCKELIFAHIPGNKTVPKVGEEVTLTFHPINKRLIASRMNSI